MHINNLAAEARCVWSKGIAICQPFCKAPWVLLILGMSGAMSACQRPSATALVGGMANSEPVKEGLSFQNVLLEQADSQGRLLWKIRGLKAVYSRDQEVAQVEQPKGELFQDGKVVYRFTAQRGTLQRQGQRIALAGQIIATAVADNSVLRGNEAEWQPQKDLFIIRNQFSVQHSKIQGSAQEGRVFSRTRQLELNGQVSATMKDPVLKMRTEHLIWYMAKQQVIGDRPVQVERDQGKLPPDRASGNQFSVDQIQKTVLLQHNARVSLQKPPLEIASEALIWNLKAQTLISEVPLQVQHREQGITLNSQQGWMDIPKQIFYLTGTVNGVGQRNQATLTSQRLTWYIPTRDFLATGDVFYHQQNPVFTSKGPIAQGKFQDHQVLLSGGQQNVVTQITPSPR
jgi:LPS export ABC transporter protein LptC